MNCRDVGKTVLIYCKITPAQPLINGVISLIETAPFLGPIWVNVCVISRDVSDIDILNEVLPILFWEHGDCSPRQAQIILQHSANILTMGKVTKRAAIKLWRKQFYLGNAAMISTSSYRTHFFAIFNFTSFLTFYCKI